MAENILQIEKLSKSFNGLILFDDADLCLQQGTINSLFGGNGAGKTTFFNMIGGYVNPDSGTIKFGGMPVKFQKEHRIAKAGVGKMWQEPAIFPNHSVLENMLVSDKSHPGEFILNYVFHPRKVLKKEVELKEKALGILDKFKLKGKLSQPAGGLSLGERKLLSISMMLMNDTKLLLLDEPFSNVNEQTIDRMSEAIVSLKEEGRTVFMIEHKVRFAKAISDNCFLIREYKVEKLTVPV